MKRHWLFWILIVAFIWIIVTRFTEIESLARILSQGQWEWVLAAAVLQILYYAVLSATYQSAFDILEVSSRLRDLIPITLSSVFVNVVAPSAGASGAALFVDDAGRRGQSMTRAAIGTILQLVAMFSTLSIILIVGLVYLFVQRDLQTYEVIGAILMFLITLVWDFVVTLGIFRPTLLRRLLDWAQLALDWVARKLHRAPFLAESWAENITEEFIVAASAIAKYPKKLGRTLGIALAAHIVDIASLYTLFLAFDRPIQYGPLVAGYALGITFAVISPTPQGIGVVEGVMALVYTSLGIPGSAATTVSIAFRGLTFWLPLALGAMLIRRTRTFKSKPAPSLKNPDKAGAPVESSDPPGSSG